MSHLLFWPTITYFYPVGNTSAVCLTENLSPESKADVLLLACGDPRHILYTIYADETNPLGCLRLFDITCCDVDVAILARNALLFTLLADDGVLDKLDDLWNLFYHMFVDQTPLSILFEQCRKLIVLAESTETWRAGPYGHFLTTCDAATLAGLRRMWAAYLDTATFSSHREDKFERSFISGMKETSQKRRSGTTAARSAGPFAPHADQAVVRQFSSYWSSGTTEDSTQGQRRKRSLKVNPTFAFSLHGDEFAVQYATDPLGGFHLAEAFASGKFARPYEDVPPRELVQVAKDQFSRWCTSVSKRLKDNNPSSPTFVIRMFAGDVLKFCQALKYCEVSRSPITPYTVAAWRLSTITLDGHSYGHGAVSPAPLSFNVIDTSNISDHVGLVNLLVVTAPLLRKTPSATLYTEALLKKGDNTSQTDLEHICGDLTTMALLLGVVPSTFISQFTTRSNAYANRAMAGGTKSYHERLAWKQIGFGGSRGQRGPDDVPVPPARLSFLPEHLANFLFRVYLRMFSDEDMESRFQQLPFLSFEGALQTMRLSGILHYTRRSFALLLHFIKTRIQTDWQRTMVLFEKLVTTDSRLLMGQHAYQELCCQLHLLGVYTTEWISLQALQRNRLEYKSGTVAMFHDWTQSSIPQVVVLALVVPRDVMARLEYDFSRVGTPLMQCDTHDGSRVNHFAVTSATFGWLRASGKGENRTAVVVQGGANAGAGMDMDASEDAPVSGMRPPWRTEAPLVITFSIPSSSLMDFGRNPDATVGLALRATPNVAAELADRLGPELKVFRTKLRDAERVFVLAQTPVVGTSASGDADVGASAVMAGHWQENIKTRGQSEGSCAGQVTSGSDMPQETGADVQVQMNDTFSAVQSFTIRVDITDPDARTALANKQTVPTVSSCSGSTRSLDAYVRIEKHTFSLRFPIPVDIEHAKLRVARKSSYVEVVASPVPFDGQPERDISNRFASLAWDPNHDGTPTLGSIHRLNLDRCPPFQLSKDQSESGWFDSHLRLMFPDLDEERALLRQLELPKMGSNTSGPAPDTFPCVKQTLRSLLHSAADATRHGRTLEKAFVLCDSSRRGAPYLYVVVARMRLDVGSHTVVADAFVALGTPATRAALETTLRDVNAPTGGRGPQKPDDAVIQRLTTNADETAAWFHLLPRFTERCRTWPHKTNCAYRTSRQEKEYQPGEQSPGTRGRQSSLCMCSLGVGTEILPKRFQRVAPYLTRAAFSPLIPVPYLEEEEAPVGGPFADAEPRNPWETAMLGSPFHDWDADIGTGTMDGVEVGHRCRTCGKEGSRTCSGCKRVRYCSRACQRADWKSHKKDCH